MAQEEIRYAGILPKFAAPIEKAGPLPPTD